MTLTAVEPVRVTIPEQDGWVEPEIPLHICQFPACPRPGSQWHHLVKRSETGGPKDWVTIDGIVVWNKVRVCLWCHDGLNNHRYWITFEEEGWVAWARVNYKPTTPDESRWKRQPKSGDYFGKLGLVK